MHLQVSTSLSWVENNCKSRSAIYQQQCAYPMYLEDILHTMNGVDPEREITRVADGTCRGRFPPPAMSAPSTHLPSGLLAFEGADVDMLYDPPRNTYNEQYMDQDHSASQLAVQGRRAPSSALPPPRSHPLPNSHQIMPQYISPQPRHLPLQPSALPPQHHVDRRAICASATHEQLLQSGNRAHTELWEKYLSMESAFHNARCVRTALTTPYSDGPVPDPTTPLYSSASNQLRHLQYLILVPATFFHPRSCSVSPPYLARLERNDLSAIRGSRPSISMCTGWQRRRLLIGTISTVQQLLTSRSNSAYVLSTGSGQVLPVMALRLQHG
jgi:hypothetical protein